MKKKKVKSPTVTKAKTAIRKPKQETEIAALKRQLKIEASLERVRAQAMIMRTPDDLPGICEVLFSELRALGFTELRNAMINIHDDEHGTFINYDYSDEIGKSINHLTYSIHPVIEKQVRQIRSAGDAFSETSFTGKDLKDWKAFREKLGEKEDPRIERSDALYYYFHSIGTGAVGISTFKSISAAKKNLLKRFRNVFEFAYRRYADVAQAIAQARAARIEVALEKVRSRTMAMQRSNELADVATLLFQQVKELGITAWTAGFNIWQPDGASYIDWITDPAGDFLEPYTIDLTTHAVFRAIRDARQRGDDFFVSSVEGEQIVEIYKLLSSFGDKGQFQKILDSGREFPTRQFNHFVFGAQVSLMFITYEPCPEAWDIYKRFGKVFEQTYTRFLDLQKAEAQAREAQIEAALERVRSRSMAMHKSDELLAVITVVSEQLEHLKFKFNTVSFAINNQAHDYTFWFAVMGNPTPLYIQVPYLSNPMFDRVKDVLVKGANFYTDTLTPEESRQWHEHVFANADLPFLTEETKAYILSSGYARSVAITKSIMLVISNYAAKPYSGDQNDIIRRFAVVFEQSYTRFLDLKKAEAQAREAQIEVALERIRAKALAMHKSADLLEVANVLREQMGSLGQPDLESAIVHLYDDSSDTFRVWYSYRPPNLSSGKVTTGVSRPSKSSSEWAREVIANYESPKMEYTVVAGGEKLKEWYKILEKVAPAVVEFDDDGHLLIPDILYYHFSKFSGGALLMISNQEASLEARELLRRAAVVFDLAYTRFNDLKQAEAQAREAKIEASLERVRSKAMGMHSSEDLAATIGIFYRELESFSITPRRCGVGLLDRETRMAELSTMNTTAQGDSIEVVGKIKLVGHPVLEAIFEGWLQQVEYHPVLRGNEIGEYYRLLRPQISFPEYPNDAVQFGYFFFFPEGGVYAWTEKELSEDELKIYRRFTSVLSLTYKRYKDLKDAEVRTQLAIRESSLDRLRAGIASMRTAEDLERITPLVWHELMTLGVPFFRCGVFIINEEAEKINVYLSTPQGKPLAALQLGLDSSELNKKAVAHWRKQKVYVEHWDKEQFTAFAKSLMQQGQIQTANSYQGGDEPPESLTLQFIPFTQGMLYVGSAEPLSESQIELTKALADAFSVAYARYEDFSKLESAKAQIEKTLTDLKQTQFQLVQSEKMASLGELTAGIAHEIQNPLNFVNNFSEVSTELVDEMNDELQKGNTADARKIAEDLKQNLEKINHHGRRAGDIVKSMLQHSSTGSGVKEPTDINALADEYLRLAYHGLRAKDKSFNASMKTEFDKNIGSINIIPQDIGRVILNLITNAFYAVTESKKQLGNGYDPTVTIRTE
ncbi:MAG TPA: histidine kinase dimerization/phospho-acceptor domain-containing protein, partial [Chryseolinea sp.]|nr:histidine kinase dimerization/phospho-acceptor domain-containing protein [Chryseolinea sp.]